MKSFYSYCLSLSLFSCAVSAAEWHSIQYRLPQGSHVTSFAGTLVVPSLPQTGVYYIWPGLQHRDHEGVYQNVLDGSSGNWWMAGGWCCGNPSLPWGDGFSVGSGENVLFSNVQGGTSGSQWTTTLTKTKTGLTTRNTFELSEKLFQRGQRRIRLSFLCLLVLISIKAGVTFDLVLFTIELQGGASWDFGPLTFKDITIVRSSLPEYLSKSLYLLSHRRPQAQTSPGAIATRIS